MSRSRTVSLRVSAAEVGALAAPAAGILIAAAALALRLTQLSRVQPDPFYDAAVRSMGTSWHAFLFGALEPGASVAIDKPAPALWPQVAAVKLLGFSTGSLLLPAALAGVLGVWLLYRLVSSLWGRAAGLAAAAALAVLPLAVLTARSDTMDELATTLSLLAAVALVAAARAEGAAARAGGVAARAEGAAGHAGGVAARAEGAASADSAAGRAEGLAARAGGAAPRAEGAAGLAGGAARRAEGAAGLAEGAAPRAAGSAARADGADASAGRWLLAAAGVAVGAAFNVKLFQALIPVPALVVLYVAASPLRIGERLSRVALCAAVAAAVGLSWLAVVSTAPGREQPYAFGSRNGSALSAAFAYNGLDRLHGTADESVAAAPARAGAARTGASAAARGAAASARHRAAAASARRRAAVSGAAASGRHHASAASARHRAVSGASAASAAAVSGAAARHHAAAASARHRAPVTSARHRAVSGAAASGRHPAAAGARHRAGGGGAGASTGRRVAAPAPALSPQAAADLAKRPDPAGPARLVGRGGDLRNLLGVELIPALLAAALALVLLARRPATRLARAGVAGLGTWLLTGLALFSFLPGLQVRYVDALAPAVAAALGGAVVALARRPWLAAPAMVVLLALPTAQAIHVVRTADSDSGHIGALRPGQAARMASFLDAHTAGDRYELASATAVKAVPIVERDARPVLMLGTLAGQPIVPLRRFLRDVSDGDVHYVLASERCGPRSAHEPGGCGSAARWARVHGVDVSGLAGAPSHSLYLVSPAAAHHALSSRRYPSKRTCSCRTAHSRS